MKIYLASDHGGYLLKEQVKKFLTNQFVDLGATEINSLDDYPSFAFNLAEQVVQSGDDSIGLLFCRSGSGMVIAANKVKGARAVDVYNQAIAQHAVSHNHANIFAFGADFIKTQEVLLCLVSILKTKVDLSERHLRRLKQIKDYEANH